MSLSPATPLVLYHVLKQLHGSHHGVILQRGKGGNKGRVNFESLQMTSICLLEFSELKSVTLLSKQCQSKVKMLDSNNSATAAEMLAI